eukprot:TRINITY_DN40096_c3_g1_i2.p3 TRINITY_DN40096_c3_g1~~TRINITY_DN40096_c3_g1_i2.p3  ORF type:complete len:169 (-),score=32.86 TRINITY_DN40096_c3_g1_i2:555-1013(-)
MKSKQDQIPWQSTPQTMSATQQNTTDKDSQEEFEGTVPVMEAAQLAFLQEVKVGGDQDSARGPIEISSEQDPQEEQNDMQAADILLALQTGLNNNYYDGVQDSFVAQMQEMQTQPDYMSLNKLDGNLFFSGQKLPSRLSQASVFGNLSSNCI